MSLDIVPPLAYAGSIMVSRKHWVVCPPEDSKGEDAPFYYGVKQFGYQLYIASGCCGELMASRDRIGSSAMCSFCHREYPISPYDGFDGEDEPFTLNWGQFAWDRVEERIDKWLDFYLNLKRDGEVVISFDGKSRKDYTSD